MFENLSGKYGQKVFLEQKKTTTSDRGSESDTSLPLSAASQCAASPAPAVSSGADTVSRAAGRLKSCQLPRPPGQAEGYVWRSRGPRNSAPSPLQIYSKLK